MSAVRSEIAPRGGSAPSLEVMTVQRLDAVLAIEVQAYTFPWTRGNFIDSIAAGYLARVLIADDGELIGYFVAMPGFEEMHLLNVTVSSRHEGQGHARRLLAELRLSGADVLRAEVEEMLLEHGLPVKLDDVDVEQVIFHTARDKKRTGEGPVPFVLCPAPGRPLIGQTVSPAELRAAIKELI